MVDRYLGLTGPPLLKTLIEESASPLAVIEDDFAADAVRELLEGWLKRRK